MSTFTIRVYECGQWHTIQCIQGQTLLAALGENGIPAICGGRGLCGKCAVKITQSVPPATDEDQRFFTPEQLAEGNRLACITPVTEGMEIIIDARFNPDKKKGFHILNTYESPASIDCDRFKLTPFTPEASSISRVTAMQTACSEDWDDPNPEQALLRKAAELINQKTVYLLSDSSRLLDVFFDRNTRVYGIAVDLGTTTIAFELLDLLTGRTLSAYSAVNRQRAFGADVVTRIQQASQDDKLATLHKYVTEDIRNGAAILCHQAGVKAEAVRHMAIAGNTVMLHLLLGISCHSLGQFPFTPTFTGALVYPFAEIFGDSPLSDGSPDDSSLSDRSLSNISVNDCSVSRGSLSCPVTILPGISAFVGADIAAGLLFCGGLTREKPSMLIDLGTNGEMALFSKQGVLCTSTAAGPAFEAANITCGTGSIPGAIARVSYQPENNVYIYDTIGGRPPIGLCGSGVVDMAAQLVTHGWVDETGLLDDAYFDDGVMLAPEAGIVFTQKDIRELQLAKSAVRSGLELLLASAGHTYADIEHVFLSGGFGHKIDLDSAQTLGIIPAALREKVTAVGNSSLGGCAMTLIGRHAGTDIAEITRMAKEINLSADPRFNDMFMEYMMF